MPSKKTKTCPFCREEIDLLAVKCVHCGERVGQPLGIERQLTEDDIGRPEQTDMQMSESFVSAYQRLRELTVVTPQTQALPRVSTGKARLRAFGFSVGAIALLVGLLMVVNHVVGLVAGMPHSKRVAQCEALLIEAQSAADAGDLITAVERGNEALKVYTGNEQANQTVAELRERLMEKAQRLFDEGDLDAALTFCKAAIEADPTNAALGTLRSSIHREMRRSEVSLKAVGGEGRAMFIKPDGSQVTLDVGDTMSDLGFKLKSASTADGTAVLYDLRRNRDIIFRVRSGGRGQVLESPAPVRNP